MEVVAFLSLILCVVVGCYTVKYLYTPNTVILPTRHYAGDFITLPDCNTQYYVVAVRRILHSYQNGETWYEYELTKTTK